jgi:AraC-like DNA-binding protein
MRGIVLRAVSYQDHSAEPVRMPTVASLTVPMILSFGPRITVLDSDGGEGQVLTSFVAGPDDGHGMTEFTGAQDGMQIDLTPLGASMLFGVPMDQLARQVVDLVDLLGADGRRLVERVAETPDPSARIGLVEEALTTRLQRAREPSPAVRWAWDRLVRSGGMVPVGMLARELGCSNRYLIAQFRAHVGFPPKTAARIMRFQRVLRRLDERSGGNLGRIALEAGYFDQAHLNRDFREFAGTTPGDFVRSVQAPLAAPALA